MTNARRGGLHKLSTRLVAEFDSVVVEDFNVSGMVRNRTLAVLPQCWAIETSPMETP